MPLTPETWLEQFVVNLTTSGAQTAPSITHLSNGSILVTWQSNDQTGVGSAPGLDVIGQLFDPLGNRIGVEFRVNGSFFADDERDGDVAALVGGGFVTVYEDVDASTSAIRLTQRDNTGTEVRTVTIQADSASGALPDNFDPAVAVSSATSALVVWREFEATGGDSRIVGKIYDPASGAVGALISLINFNGSNGDPVVTALTNGNYVIAASTFVTGGSSSSISYRIVSASGVSVLGATQVPVTGTDADSDGDPGVTALTGGGFVIAWANSDVNDTDIEFRVFNAAGASVSGVVTVNSDGATDSNNEAQVVALLDGGFLVIYDDDEVGQLVAQRYDAAGATVGSRYIIATGSAITQPDAELLDDGRVAVTFLTATGEVGMEILDIRDAPNAPAVYGPDSWQVGTIGNDVFTADGFARIVAAHSGNDTVTESGFTKTYLMGAGNDRLIVVSQINTDIHNGGPGTDTIDWSGVSETGAVFDLRNGTATNAAGTSTEQMLSFDNLTGTANADSISGTNGANVLSGGGGDDDMFGAGVRDFLFGGAGDDTLNGGAANDFLQGGAGNDSYVVDNLGDSVTEGAGGGTADRVNANIGVSLAVLGIEIENLTLVGTGNIGGDGNARANVMTGNSGNNAMAGLDGDDTLNGGAGNDDLAGGIGNDSLLGGTGNDTLLGGAGNDTLGGGVDADSLNGGSGDDSLNGNDGNDRLDGSTGNDTLLGAAQNDVLLGGGGNDTLTGGAGNDTLTGGGNADTFIFAGTFGVDRISDFAVAQAGERIDLSGVAAITSFADLTANHLSQSAGNSIITAGANTITLLGVSNAQLTAGDFIF